MSWSPDGKTLAYLKEAGSGSTGNEIWLLSLGDRDAPATARRLVPGPLGTARAEFSPDGRFLAYESGAAGRNEVYVQPVSGAGRRVTISSNGGVRPAWAGHGRELFYWEDGSNGMVRVMAVDVKLGESFSAGVPHMLFEITAADYPPGVSPIRAYDVTNDGTRFLMARNLKDSIEPPIAQIVVAQNWLEELKRIVPAK
jgi:dipeptidyl aminopeptidase/acylaminoacyl peptidase